MMASKFSTWGNDLYTGKKSYDIVGKRKNYFIAAIVCVVLSLAILGIKNVNFGIEFRGGSQFTVTNANSTDQQVAVDAVSSVLSEEQPRVSNVGTNALRIQTNALDEQQVIAVRDALMKAYDVTEDDVASANVGPSWGKDVSGKALQGLIVFIILVMVVMAVYFRAWRMAAAAIIALFHDLILTIGVYALIGWEVTPATVIGLLTILGYSIYDTVVVFDKVKENTTEITEQHLFTYAERANLAVNQTLVRSINTSVVALLPVGSILFIGTFILGAGTLRDIALSLFVGMAVGAYSSIFLATPLEVALRMGEPVIAQHTEEVLAQRAARKSDGSGVAADSVAGPAAVVGALSDQPSASGIVVKGGHQGNRAQPKRKKK